MESTFVVSLKLYKNLFIHLCQPISITTASHPMKYTMHENYVQYYNVIVNGKRLIIKPIGLLTALFMFTNKSESE